MITNNQPSYECCPESYHIYGTTTFDPSIQEETNDDRRVLRPISRVSTSVHLSVHGRVLCFRKNKKG